MKRYGGCRKARYPAHETKLPFRVHPAMGLSKVPAEMDFRGLQLTPPVKDQGPTSSCNPHRCSSAVQTRLKALGAPLAWTPSEADWYRAAREIERARLTPIGMDLPLLKDIGSYTEDCVLAARSFGIKPRAVLFTKDGRDSDVDPVTINEDQKLGDLEAASMTLVTGEYAINPQASDAVLQVQMALASLIPVGFDFFVDTSFETWGEAWTSKSQPCGPPNLADKKGGGHAILCVGYRTESNGTVSFLLLNTWGKEIGDAGYWWCSEAWVRAVWEISVWDVRLVAPNLLTGVAA